MQKLFYYLMGLICSITGIYFIYLMFNINKVEHISQLLSPMFISIISIVLFIMLEERPRKTYNQIKYDEDVKSRGILILVLISFVICILLFSSSCSRAISVQDAANGRARCGMHLK